MIEVAKEKEEKLVKTKADLAMREQKLKEEKVLQDARSDPESVTSSLTSFSTSSANVHPTSSPDIDKIASKKKDKQQNSSVASSDEINKKQCIDDGSGVSNESGPKGKDYSVKKMSSSVSDMTDSNKGSSDGKESKNGSDDDKKTLIATLEVCSQRSGEIEVSSTAAVVSGIGSQEHGHEHADIVIKTGPRRRKRKHNEETNSLDDSFSLNYEEVFMSSNVPQMIATLAGRIITCKNKIHNISSILRVLSDNH